MPVWKNCVENWKKVSIKAVKTAASSHRQMVIKSPVKTAILKATSPQITVLILHRIHPVPKVSGSLPVIKPVVRKGIRAIA